ncbi:hypothetical protein Rsub_04245 [Raphidocelis subcapitata]|uniref:C3H1-type domain-containing protein n=1 Tax=Raphidocelis subcapitata TaxID=307507 RepID=A0A2V0P361_9CHLO|nr:hypothetical protein Rsub_04245 [Raphidocelis subcapitata]|eukprot:GBF91505.1 hypothetical protein Rsub_04245 [Raphidocelis subcapitata]
MPAVALDGIAMSEGQEKARLSSDSDADDEPLSARFQRHESGGGSRSKSPSAEPGPSSSSDAASGSSGSSSSSSSSSDDDDDGSSGSGGDAHGSRSGSSSGSGEDSGGDGSGGDGEDGGSGSHKRKKQRRREGSAEGSSGSKRRASGSDASSSGEGSDGGARPRKRRRTFFPRISSTQRCGQCHTCLNPQMKKACLTRREEMQQQIEKRGHREEKRARKRAAAAARAADADGNGVSAKPSAPKAADPRRASAAAAAAEPREAPKKRASSGGGGGGGGCDATSPYVEILAPLIDNAGKLKPDGAAALVAELPRFPSPLSRALPVIVLGRSRPAELSAFMAAGGVDVLAAWVADARPRAAAGSKEDAKLLVHLLDAVAALPAGVAFLKSSPITKAVGGLRKHPVPEVAAKAVACVQTLSQRAQGGGSGSSGGGGSSAGTGPAPAAGGDQPAAKRAKLEQAQRPAAGAGASKPAAAGAGVSGGNIHLLSDNNLFRQASAPAKPKAQPPKPGVQRMDSGEALQLASAHRRSSSDGGAAAAAAQRVTVQITVRPDGSGVDLKIKPPPGSRGAPAARGAAAGAAASSSAAAAARPGGRFGISSIIGGGGAGAGAGAAAGAGGSTRIGGVSRIGAPASVTSRLLASSGPPLSAAALRAQRAAAQVQLPEGEAEPRRRRAEGGRRVGWHPDVRLASVRWFKKEDAPLEARADRAYTDEELRRAAHPAASAFSEAARQEHVREREMVQQMHQKEQRQHDHEPHLEPLRAAVAHLAPRTPWALPPPAPLDAEWGVAAGEESTERGRVAQAIAARGGAPPPMHPQMQTPREPPELLASLVPAYQNQPGADVRVQVIPWQAPATGQPPSEQPQPQLQPIQTASLVGGAAVLQPPDAGAGAPVALPAPAPAAAQGGGAAAPAVALPDVLKHALSSLASVLPMQPAAVPAFGAPAAQQQQQPQQQLPQHQPPQQQLPQQQPGGYFGAPPPQQPLSQGYSGQPYPQQQQQQQQPPPPFGRPPHNGLPNGGPPPGQRFAPPPFGPSQGPPPHGAPHHGPPHHGPPPHGFAPGPRPMGGPPGGRPPPGWGRTGRPCNFFNVSGCNKGDACPFLHIPLGQQRDVRDGR